jgi:hypothetical protein|tara:strand:+ start:222 stop:1055 length:834 start_codon:yes stop_codon:yes gene_type:complete
MPNKVKTLEPSTIETIDLGIYEYVNEKLNLHTTTNEGFKKTPVIWLGTDRLFQVKNNKDIRDKVGKIKLPIITVNRDSIAKDPQFKGSFQAHLYEGGDYKGGAITRVRRIQQEKTRNFANADFARSAVDSRDTGRSDNKKVVYEFLTSPIPTYVTVMYTVVLRTEYQQQMNDLMTPFITRTGQLNTFMFEYDGHKYEAFIQSDFSENKNTTSLNEEERMFETKVQIKVLGYLIGDGVNREKPQITIRENIVDVKISRERVITGDKAPWKKKDKDYRD